jgi:L-lactate dehydrogenase complex protein LldF
MSAASEQFLRDATTKAADAELRQIVRKGMEQYDGAAARGRARFLDWEAARQRCQEVKQEAIDHLDHYLLEFEQKVKERSGHVFWAETAEEARNYVVDLALRSGVRTVVKSKSMVAEEIHLNRALEERGIKAWETDLGEFIVQLRSEPPFHIVTPAMHLTRQQIGELFREKLEGVEAEDPESLVAAARRALRQAFYSAEMGITGANFLVADCGMIAITTNEGNARFCSSLPRIHVAIAGIEKVIPRFEDLAVLWPVLATAGTGQAITCYNTLIGGPRAEDEPDGPEEFHVVLLDNGRTRLLADAEQREVLHCIRCGACLNTCPVFRSVGGHAYGTIYSGPIGSVLTPHLRGLGEFQHLSFASSLCGACTSVCPVKIDLHHHLLQNRRNAVDETLRPVRERIGFRLWRWAMMGGRRFGMLGWAARWGLRLAYGMDLQGAAFDPARAWTKDRAAAAIPRNSFRAIWRKTHGAG